MSWLERINGREARRVVQSFAVGELETRDLAQDHLAQFAHHARAVAKPRLQEAAEYLRHEGTAVAKGAARQAGRITRAVKADPVPAIVAVVGLALLASMLIGRRRP